jgi:hypothetical protein
LRSMGLCSVCSRSPSRSFAADVYGGTPLGIGFGLPKHLLDDGAMTPYRLCNQLSFFKSPKTSSRSFLITTKPTDA